MSRTHKAPKQVMHAREKQRYNPQELSEVELAINRLMRIPRKRKPRADIARPYRKVHTFVSPTLIHRFDPRTGVTTHIKEELPPCIQTARPPRPPAWTVVRNPYVTGVKA